MAMKRKLWLLIGLMFLFLLPASVAGAETITGEIQAPDGRQLLAADFEQMLYMEHKTEDWSVYADCSIFADGDGVLRYIG
jgi:hypothetical protein